MSTLSRGVLSLTAFAGPKPGAVNLPHLSEITGHSFGVGATPLDVDPGEKSECRWGLTNLGTSYHAEDPWSRGPEEAATRRYGVY